MKEIIEMFQILLEMNTNTYLMCKYTLLAVSREEQCAEDFIIKMFSLTDSHMPLLIEMKEEI